MTLELIGITAAQGTTTTPDGPALAG